MAMIADFAIVEVGPSVRFFALRSAGVTLDAMRRTGGTAGRRHMPAGGSSISTDADGYQASVQDILDLVVLQPRNFHARLTWADLPSLQLLRAKELSARVGYLTLPPDWVYMVFPARQGSTLLYDGITLAFGDFILHSLGERLHQRTTGACEWASIAITPAALSAFGRALSGKTLVAPAVGQTVRPRRANGRRLERLHARACRAVERNLDSISNREVVRALEQDLIGALISCLANGKVQEDCHRPDQGYAVLPAFELMLAKEPHRLLATREICVSLGISETKFRAVCSVALGMSPSRYQRLRRLKLVRAELLRAKSSAKSAVEETVVRYGFSSLNGFITEYWGAYGEMPPIRPLDPTDE
jgi:AraC-like DNA-binding protein